MIFSRLSSSLGLRKLSRGERRSLKRQRTSLPLQLEPLEDRLAPAVDTWTGGAGTLNWTDAANWSLGAVPTSADDVVIDTPVSGSIQVNITNAANQSIRSLSDSAASLYVTGGALSIVADSTFNGLTISGGSLTAFGQWNIGGTLEVSGGTLTFEDGAVYNGIGMLLVDGGTVDFSTGNAIELAALTQSAGTLTGSDTLTVTGQTVWTGGTMSGSGTTVAQGGLQLGAEMPDPTYYVNQEVLDGRTLTNAGNAVWLGNSSYGNIFYQQNGGTFTNLAGATLDFQLQSYGAWYGDSSGTTFNNQGTLQQTADSGVTYITAALNNSGSVQVDSGMLSLQSQSDVSDSGSFTVGAGAILQFDGSTTTTLANGARISGEGTLEFSGGTVRFGSGAVYNGTGLLLVERAGSVDFSTGNAVQVAALTVTNGTLTGSDTVTVTGETVWTGGTMSGSGTTVAQGGLQLGAVFLDSTFHINQEILDGRTLTNAGNAVWLGNSGYGNIFYQQNGSTFTNLAGATLDIQLQSDGYWYGDSSGTTFNNQGAVTKSDGSVTAYITAALNNSGSVEVDSGTLSLYSQSDVSDSGSFTVGVGASLQFSGAYSTTLSSGASVSGAGTVVFAGGSVVFGDGAVYDGTGLVLVGGGSVDFSTGNAVQVAALALSSGALTGSDTVTVTGPTLWTGGTMSGSGTTVAQGGLQLGAENPDSIYYTNQEVLDGRTLTNAGNAVWLGNSGYGNIFYQQNGGTFTNLAGATLDFQLQSDGFWYDDGSGSRFNNQGTLQKSTGGGTTFIYPAFSNAGTLDVESGTLNLAGGFSNFSSNTVSGGTYIVQSALQFSDAAIQTNRATIVLKGSASQIIDQNGTDALAGFSTNGSEGSFAIENGRDIALADSFTNSGTVTIGTGSTFTASSYTQNGGTTQLAGGTLAAAGGVSLTGGTLNGNGTVTGDVSNAGTLAPGSATTPGQITIDGSYTQTSGGTLEEKIAGNIIPGIDYDQLVINGVASLAGTINVNVVNGYTPQPGHQYQIMDFASSSGDFATTNGFVLSTNTFLKEQVNAANLALQVIGIPTVTVTGNGGTYKASPFAATNALVAGVGSDEILASFGSSTLSYTYYAGTGTGGANLGSSAPINAGTYTVVAHYTSDNPNYTNADSVPVTFAITQAPLTVTAIASDKQYDGTTKAAVTLSDNRVGSDQIAVSYTSANFADSKVGNNKTVTVSGISLSGASAGNYTLQSTTASTTANITLPSSPVPTHDGQSRLIGIVYPNGNVYERVHASDGSSTATLTNPTTNTVSSGVRSNGYTYDPQGQLTSLVAYYTNGDVFTRTYASDGASTATLTNSSGPVSSGVTSQEWTYNAQNQLTLFRINYTNGNVLTRTYASDGTSTATLTNSSGTVSNGVRSNDHTYNTAGQLALFHAYYTNGDVFTRTYASDGTSTATLTNSSGPVSSGVTSQEWTYNAQNQLTLFRINYTNGNVLTRTYASDGTSTATLTNSSGTVSNGVRSNDYTYNAAGQLTLFHAYYTNGDVFTRTYTYDANGNSTGSTAMLTNSSGTTSPGVSSQAYAYNAQNQLTLFRINYTNGNVLTRTYVSDGTSTATLTNSSGPVSSGVTSQDYTYNAAGQLTLFHAYYTNGNIFTRTYASDGTSTATLTNSSGPVSNGVTSQDWTYNVQNQLTLFHIYYTNGNVFTRTYASDGTSTATLSNNGTVLHTYSYDAQGNPISST